MPQLAGKRVLVVDDNATNREIVSRHARSWGMEAVAVESPSDALALIAAGERFDVAVLDLVMPEMDGVDLAREIRRHRDERELPLVLADLARPAAGGAVERSVRRCSSRSRSRRPSSTTRSCGSLAEHGRRHAGVERRRSTTRPETSRLRILLAEDNAMNQKVALRLLERLGYRADVVVERARGAGSARAAAIRRRADGRADARAGRARRVAPDPRALATEARPRIVAMTANALPEDREACFAAGMDDYVAKPIRREGAGRGAGACAAARRRRELERRRHAVDAPRSRV